jgi:DNA replication protein DnaC
MNALDTLEPKLRSLRLQAMLQRYAACIHNAEQENWGYRRFLHRLVEIEEASRISRKVKRLLDDSDLPAEFTLEALPQGNLCEKPRRMLPSLLSGDFVRRGDNVLCFGLPGRGKSHYAAAIGRELVRQQQMRVLFVEGYRLVSQPLQAKAENNLPRSLEQLGKIDAIILDDVGYVQHTADEMEVLFIFMSERYQQRKTLMLTSNLVFSEWDRIFKKPMTAMAAVDRLVHRAIILEFSREKSHREEAAEARQL